MPKNSKNKVILSWCMPVTTKTVNYSVTKSTARQLRLLFVCMIPIHPNSEGVAETPLVFPLPTMSRFQEARSVALIPGTAAVGDALGDSVA